MPPMLQPTIPVTKPATALPLCKERLLNTMAIIPQMTAMIPVKIPATIQKNGRIIAMTLMEVATIPTLIDAMAFPFGCIDKTSFYTVYFKIDRKISQDLLSTNDFVRLL